VIARESVCADGTSRAIAGRERVAADRALTDALVRAAPSAHAGAIVSVDLFYDEGARRDDPDDALAIEMEAATLFALGARAGVPVACLLTVTDTFDERGARTRIDERALHGAAERMGAVALAALAD
jgi:uridine phosphorylase